MVFLGGSFLNNASPEEAASQVGAFLREHGEWDAFEEN